MKRLLTIVLAASPGLLGVTCCLAQQPPESEPSQITRQEWRERVEASRRTAAPMRHVRRNDIAPPPPTLEEIAEEATRRVLEDDSLMPGDIVSTNRGLFRFRGDPDGERRPEDFVPIGRARA